MSAATLPAWRQSLRALRVIVHALWGIVITTVAFPRSDPARRRSLTQNWCRRLVQLAHVDIDLRGPLVAGDDARNIVYVANHVSWLDIFVLNALSPARFIAKAELAHWPVIGKLIRDTETIFVERARKADTLRVNADAEAVLRSGGRLVLFPEGTTGDGREVLRFHGSLLQPVIAAAGVVQPVALRYRDPDGRTSAVVEYVGATTFVQTFWRVCGARALAVEVTAFPVLAAAAATRRQLAAGAEELIRSAVLTAAAAKAPGTACDRPAGSP